VLLCLLQSSCFLHLGSLVDLYPLPAHTHAPPLTTACGAARPAAPPIGTAAPPSPCGRPRTGRCCRLPPLQNRTAHRTPVLCPPVESVDVWNVNRKLKLNQVHAVSCCYAWSKPLTGCPRAARYSTRSMTINNSRTYACMDASLHTCVRACPHLLPQRDRQLRQHSVLHRRQGAQQMHRLAQEPPQLQIGLVRVRAGGKEGKRTSGGQLLVTLTHQLALQPPPVE